MLHLTALTFKVIILFSQIQVNGPHFNQADVFHVCMLRRFRHLKSLNGDGLFDVGGISVFFFLEELPVLDNEMFYSTKPGLSAYVDIPEMVSSLSGLIDSIERVTLGKPRRESPRAFNVIEDYSRQEG